MDKSKKLIIVIILLVVIIGGVSFYAFHQAKENKEMSELFAVEKLEMENEYTAMINELYNRLKSISDEMNEYSSNYENRTGGFKRHT